MKNRLSLLETLAAGLIVIFFGTITTMMMISGVQADQNNQRLTDLKLIQKKIETFKKNGGKIVKTVNGHDEWQIASFSPATEADSIDSDEWTSRDAYGNKLSFYFQNETYPQDNKGWLYKIQIINSESFDYWLKACNPKAEFKDESSCVILKNQR